MRELSRGVPVAAHVAEWIAQLVVATHPESPAAPPLVKKYVRYGASPRGAQALMLGAKVVALLAGRYNVAFDDVKGILAPALRHRLLLNFEALAENVRPDDILEQLAGQVEPVAIARVG
jgi:MoxR-like ATPase